MEEKKVFFLLLVLGVACFVFSIYIFYKAIKAKGLIKQSETWPTTHGKIIEARLAHHIDKDNDGTRRVIFFLIKEYSYSVLGKNFISKNRFASDDVMKFKFRPIDDKEKEVKKLSNLRKLKKIENREKLIQLLDAFIDDEVKVFYNPSSPQQACLLTKMHPAVYGNLFGAFVIFTVSIGLLFLVTKF